MRRLVAAALVLVVAVFGCAKVLPVGPVPAFGEASDELFVLVVRSPADRYAAGQPIEVGAELIYQGPRNVETVYHAASPIGWQIVQLDGPAVMGGGMDMPCLTTEVRPGEVRRYPFEKAGAVDEIGPFTRAWFEEPDLRLPAGRWRVSAALSVTLGDCGGEPHALGASVDLLVGQ